MRVLVIRLGSLGDVVYVNGVMTALGMSVPGVVVDVVTKEAYAELLSCHPQLGRLIGFDGLKLHRGVTGLVRFVGQLRQTQYDWAFDLHANFRSRIFTAASRARNKRRYNKGVWERRVAVWKRKPVLCLSVLERYLEPLRPLGVRDLPDVRIHLSHENRQQALKLLRTDHVHNRPRLIALAPGARTETKRWPEERFAQVARMITGRLGGQVVIVGDDVDRPLAERVVVETGGCAQSLAGQTTLAELAACLEQCDLLVSNDSGPMHVAAAVGTPVVALFGPTVEGFGFVPPGDRHRILSRDLLCRPCSLHGSRRCPQKHFRCMREIGVEDVFREVQHMLGQHISPDNGIRHGLPSTT